MEEQLKNLLQAALDETGADLEAATSELALFAAERTAYLATLVGLQGYERAVIAERDRVALRAGIAAVDQADAAAQRALGIIQGALFLGAQVIANSSGPTAEGGL